MKEIMAKAKSWKSIKKGFEVAYKKQKLANMSNFQKHQISRQKKKRK